MLMIADVQTEQFIFMLIEANCSIIAACLPCYGPLVAKGKSPESLVRSVRSVFSLRSRTSSTQRSTSPRKGSSIDSSIGLKQASREWATANTQGRNYSNIEYHGEEDAHAYQSEGINVTKAYDVNTVRKDEV